MVEKVNEEVILVYSSPAFPPSEIDINATYVFGKDTKGTYLKLSGEKKYEKIGYIKTYFSPLDSKWEDILK